MHNSNLMLRFSIGNIGLKPFFGILVENATLMSITLLEESLKRILPPIILSLLQSSVLLLYLYVSEVIFLVGSNLEIVYSMLGICLGTFSCNFIITLAFRYRKALYPVFAAGLVVMIIPAYYGISQIPLLATGLFLLAVTASSSIIAPSVVVSKVMRSQVKAWHPILLSVLTLILSGLFLFIYSLMYFGYYPDVVLLSEVAFFLAFLSYSVFHRQSRNVKELPS